MSLIIAGVTAEGIKKNIQVTDEGKLVLGSN